MIDRADVAALENAIFSPPHRGRHAEIVRRWEILRRQVGKNTKRLPWWKRWLRRN